MICSKCRSSNVVVTFQTINGNTIHRNGPYTYGPAEFWICRDCHHRVSPSWPWLFLNDGHIDGLPILLGIGYLIPGVRPTS